MSVILFVLILGVLVFVHELGHFLLAKKFGVRVDEFGLGFPPRLAGWKKGETTYSLNWLPFGGFVKIFGETPDEESLTGPDQHRSLIHKPRWQQALVLVAGVSFNFILAWWLISAGLVVGLPTAVADLPQEHFATPAKLVLANVLADSPAARAGLQIGDELVGLRVAGSATLSPAGHLTPEAVKQFIVAHGNQTLMVNYRRGHIFDSLPGPIQEVTLTPATGLAGDGAAIGIAMDQVAIWRLAPPRALWEGLKLAGRLTVSTATGLYHFVAQALHGQAGLNNVTGPVGLAGLVGQAALLGWIYVLNFMAFISINLAVINLLPFPALDGGRLLFLLIEKIKGSMIKPALANALNLAGFVLLILLMLVVTYHDIIKLFS